MSSIKKTAEQSFRSLRRKSINIFSYFTKAAKSAFKCCIMSFSGMLTSGIPAAKGAILYLFFRDNKTLGQR